MYKGQEAGIVLLSVRRGRGSLSGWSEVGKRRLFAEVSKS